MVQGRVFLAYVPSSVFFVLFLHGISKIFAFVASWHSLILENSCQQGLQILLIFPLSLPLELQMHLY